MEELTTIVPKTMILIQLHEYDKIKQDNYELHKKIFELTANHQTLKDTISNRDEIILARDKTIDQLKRENDALKLRILELEKQNTRLSSRLDKLENNKLLKNIIICIQDLNALDLLEKHIRHNTELINLHNDRVDGCHYIKTNLTKQETDIRINILYFN